MEKSAKLYGALLLLSIFVAWSSHAQGRELGHADANDSLIEAQKQRFQHVGRYSIPLGTVKKAAPQDPLTEPAPILIKEEKKALIKLEKNVNVTLAQVDERYYKGDLDGALSLLMEAEADHPKNALVKAKIGSVYFNLGLRKAAARWWRASLEIEPNQTELLRHLKGLGS